MYYIKPYIIFNVYYYWNSFSILEFNDISKKARIFSFAFFNIIYVQGAEKKSAVRWLLFVYFFIFKYLEILFLINIYFVRQYEDTYETPCIASPNVFNNRRLGISVQICNYSILHHYIIIYVNLFSYFYFFVCFCWFENSYKFLINLHWIYNLFFLL